MNMNKLVPFVIISSLLFAGSIEETFTFSEEDFTATKENNFDLLLNQEGLYTFEEGAPLLPIFSRYILIPATAEIERVEIKEIEKAILPQDFEIYPCQPPRPISNNEDEKFDFIPPNPMIYASAAPYPGKLFDIVPSGSKSGFRIAGIVLYPFQYLPSKKKIEFYKKLKLQIHYKENVHRLKALTQAQKKVFNDGVKRLVINPEAITEYAPPDKDSPDEVDYLVITSSALAPHFQPFLDWKNKKGIRTKIITTDTIYIRYPGRDDAEKVRNCIKDYFENHGLKFVLLGGDHQVVPLRYGCVPYGTGTVDIPADLYFADLDYSWDCNQNNQFGEMTGDSVDLFADVYVGRASVDEVSQVQTFVKKDTLFEKHPDTTYLKSILFPSTWLWSDIDYHGRIVNDYIARMLGPEYRTTHLISPSSGQTRDHINQGYEFCHISGHGSPTSFSSIFTTSEISQLTNADKLAIFNSIACSVGRFDYPTIDCIAESLVNYPNGGGVAAILNSREGIGAPPCFGPSENLDVGFFNEILYHPEIGIALANAKDRYRSVAMTQISYRWCVYALNLFGDPSLMTWREKPKPVSVIHPDSIRVGPQVVQIQVSSNESPLKDALVCIQGEDAYARDYTNSQGWVSLLVNPSDTGEAAITVTAPDRFPYESEIPIRADGISPSVVIRHPYVDDDNNRLDPGETIDLFVVLENLGNAQADSVTAVLNCLSPCITIFDSTSDYGNIDVADTAYGDRYLVSASANTPMGSLIEFYLTVSERNYQWQHYFTLMVGEKERSGIWANHDTGNCLLCVTALGSIGTIDWRGEGIGMIYPFNTLWSISRLSLGSLLLGTDSSYIVDRFYGVPCSIINQDFRM
ncbi:MAG: C25 family cysteine peptidase, partial [candidate division WOR-3 bacterium]|nr:C25 family cysteine peptidase [candidate division WOR-3 bacterium]